MIMRILRNQLAGLPVLRKLKDAVSRIPVQYTDPRYNLNVVVSHLQRLRQHGVRSIANWSILELGPGGNVGNAIILCAAGASYVCCVDNYRHVDFHRELVSFYQSLVALLRNDAQQLLAVFPDLTREQIAANIDACFTPDTATFACKPGRIDYVAPCDGSSVPCESGRFDWIFSQAVMEHVKDPEGVCAENARLLKPGGFVSHQIDLRDHFQNDSLEMLKHSDRLWWWMASNSHGYVNRARAAHFEDYFRKYGLQVLQSEATERLADPGKVPRHCDARFATLSAEQLSIVGQFILGRKQDGATAL